MEPRPKGAKASEVQIDRDGFVDLSRSVRERLPARDPAALTMFYETYFDRLYGYVRRMVGEEHLAEDLTQEVFMHLYRNLESYDPARALRPWVFTLATNKVRDHWRSRQHRATQREVDIDEEARGATAISEEQGPDEKLQAEDVSNIISSAVERLPDSMRETLVLRYYEGLSFEAIGEIVGRNEAAVRKRYSRALEELRQALSRVSDLPGGAA